jgi:transposase InsO family protein
VPQKQPKRARLWRADGSCLQLRPAARHHVWSYDVVADRTHDGRPLRILTILDEYTRECLASVVARRIRSQDILLILADLFLSRGIPTHIRSDNGPEFMAIKLRQWLKHLNVAPLYIEPGSPWENGYIEVLQHGPPAQQSRGPATRSRNHPACELRTHMAGGTTTPGWSNTESSVSPKGWRFSGLRHRPPHSGWYIEGSDSVLGYRPATTETIMPQCI